MCNYIFCTGAEEFYNKKIIFKKKSGKIQVINVLLFKNNNLSQDLLKELEKVFFLKLVYHKEEK